MSYFLKTTAVEVRLNDMLAAALLHFDPCHFGENVNPLLQKLIADKEVYVLLKPGRCDPKWADANTLFYSDSEVAFHKISANAEGSERVGPYLGHIRVYTELVNSRPVLRVSYDYAPPLVTPLISEIVVLPEDFKESDAVKVWEKVFQDFAGAVLTAK